MSYTSFFVSMLAVAFIYTTVALCFLAYADKKVFGKDNDNND